MNGQHIRRIGLSFGHLRTFNDGIGELSLQLGARPCAARRAVAREHGIELHYHLPQRLHGHFGAQVQYLPTSDLQRLLHVGHGRFDLWHSLHQFNPFRPPLRCRSASCRRSSTSTSCTWATRASSASTCAACAGSRGAAPRWSPSATSSATTCRAIWESATPVHVIPLAARDLTGGAQQAVEDLPRAKFLLHVSRMAPTKNVMALLDARRRYGPRWGWCWRARAALIHWRSSPRPRVAGSTTCACCTTSATRRRRGCSPTARRSCFPSLTEGFGLPPLEAMHFGKPVFLSRLTSLPEVGGDAANYFDSFEPSAMRGTIEDAIARHQQLALAGAVAAHARSFSWARCTEQHVALYLETARRQPGPVTAQQHAKADPRRTTAGSRLDRRPRP